MKAILAFDTSNYTTSCALLFDDHIEQEKRLLPVKNGTLGLRQSDAVFLHTKNLSDVLSKLIKSRRIDYKAVGVSTKPRNHERSYMPCFLVGENIANTISITNSIPIYKFSHQQGHIASILYGANRLDLLDKQFVAFHFSGGTTECVKINNLLSGNIEIVSETSDLNAGQVIDRAGVMLGLPFPSGKYLEDLAEKSSKSFNIKSSFPNLSGVENQFKKMLDDNVESCDIAKFVQDSLLAYFIKMADEAIKMTGINTLVFAGGVMSNKYFKEALSKKYNGIFAPPEYSSDNSVGIAVLTNAKYINDFTSK